MDDPFAIASALPPDALCRYQTLYERGFKQIVEVDRNVAFVDCGLFGQCLSDKSADKPLTFSYRVIEISEVLKVADRS